MGVDDKAGQEKSCGSAARICRHSPLQNIALVAIVQDLLRLRRQCAGTLHHCSASYLPSRSERSASKSAC